MTTASAIPASSEQTSPGPPPRLLEVLQQAAAERGHSEETIRPYVEWTTRTMLFHGTQHPRDLTNAEVGCFLGHVAQTDKNCAPGDQGRTHGVGFSVPGGLFAPGSVRTPLG